VGDVISFDLAKDGRSVDIRIFVNAPHDKFVTPNTRFWEASGLDASMGAEGISVRTASVTSLIAGGISFETPSPGPEAAPDTSFTLHKDRKTALTPTLKEVRLFVARFKESMRGLSVGAPVLFLGMPVGEVTDVGLEYTGGVLRPRVEVAIYAYQFEQAFTKETLAVQKTMSREKRTDVLGRMVAEKGLRAQLRTGSLISGQLYVSLDYYPDAPKAKIDVKQDPPEFPAVVGGMAELQTQIQRIVAKLEKMPVEEIGGDVRKTLATLDATLQSATRAMNRVEGETLPEAKKTLEDLRRAVTAVERVLNSTDNVLLGPDAPAQQELREAMQEFTRAARAIRELADYLERNPETLLRGKNKENP